MLLRIGGLDYWKRFEVLAIEPTVYGDYNGDLCRKFSSGDQADGFYGDGKHAATIGQIYEKIVSIAVRSAASAQKKRPSIVGSAGRP